MPEEQHTSRHVFNEIDLPIRSAAQAVGAAATRGIVSQAAQAWKPPAETAFGRMSTMIRAQQQEAVHIANRSMMSTWKPTNYGITGQVTAAAAMAKFTGIHTDTAGKLATALTDAYNRNMSAVTPLGELRRGFLSATASTSPIADIYAGFRATQDDWRLDYLKSISGAAAGSMMKFGGAGQTFDVSSALGGMVAKTVAAATAGFNRDYLKVVAAPKAVIPMFPEPAAIPAIRREAPAFRPPVEEPPTVDSVRQDAVNAWARRETIYVAKLGSDAVLWGAMVTAVEAVGGWYIDRDTHHTDAAGRQHATYTFRRAAD